MAEAARQEQERGQEREAARTARRRRVVEDDSAVAQGRHTEDPLMLVAVRLVTLQVAVDSIMQAVPDALDLNSHLQHAMAFAATCQRNAFNLSQDEVGAIHLYTQESSLYRLMNAALRSMDRARIEPFLKYLKLLCTALYKLPQVEGLVYRGVRKTLEELGYTFGEDVILWGFTSTTSSLSQLHTPQFLGAAGDRTLMHLHIKSGVKISEFSAIPSEDEILLLPGTRLNLSRTGALNLGHGLSEVHLHELHCNLMQFNRKMIVPNTLVPGAYSGEFDLSMGFMRSAHVTISVFVHDKSFDVTFSMYNYFVGTEKEAYLAVPILSLDGPTISLQGTQMQRDLAVPKVRMRYSMTIALEDNLRLVSDAAFSCSLHFTIEGTTRILQQVMMTRFGS